MSVRSVFMDVSAVFVFESRFFSMAVLRAERALSSHVIKDASFLGIRVEIEYL